MYYLGAVESRFLELRNIFPAEDKYVAVILSYVAVISCQFSLFFLIRIYDRNASLMLQSAIIYQPLVSDGAV